MTTPWALRSTSTDSRHRLDSHLNRGLRMDIVGVDVGLSLVKPTTGVCRTGTHMDTVAHTYGDYASRFEALGRPSDITMLAVDAPVLPGGRLHYEPRPCEQVFMRGEFQRRCKCGDTSVTGTGQALRRGGVETSRSLAALVKDGGHERAFPKALGRHNIIEAFPNAFLGVCLPREVFDLRVPRGAKFDWLYDQWLAAGLADRLRSVLGWIHPEFWGQLTTNRQHDERAALICALTGICAALGSYVAIGEPEGGYFFLPPLAVWDSWGREAARRSCDRPDLIRPVEAWFDGTRHARFEVLAQPK